jgi:hypothetical protein
MTKPTPFSRPAHTGHMVLPAHALDAAADGNRISLGRTSYVHLGTDGTFGD